jgi:hypothetical protein
MTAIKGTRVAKLAVSHLSDHPRAKIAIPTIMEIENAMTCSHLSYRDWVSLLVDTVVEIPCFQVPGAPFKPFRWA